MNYESKQLTKVSVFFALFFFQFAWCVASLIAGALVETGTVDTPTFGQGLELYGFGALITGIGAVLFGRVLYESLQTWRSTRRRW